MKLRSLVCLALPLTVPFLSLGCEPATTIGPASAPQTSRLIISHDGKTLYVALADHDAVAAVDAATGAVRARVGVPGYPHRLALLSDGRVAVSARDAGTVSIVDLETRRVDAVVDVGSAPFGLVEQDGAVVVAVSGEGDLARIDLKDPTRVATRIPLGHDDPRGVVALPDGKLIVTHFTAGALSVVEQGRVSNEVDMHLPSKGFFFPNQLESVTASVDGTDVVVPHVECNNDPAQSAAGGTDLTGEPTVTYYVDGPTGYPAVVPAVSHVDPTSGLLVSDEHRPLEEATGTAQESAGAAAPVINPLNRTLLGDEKINGVTELATVDAGKLELLVARGSGNVFVRRPVLQQGESSIVGIIHLAVGAEAIQISPDGATAYVYNGFDDTVARFPVPKSPDAKSQYAGSRGTTVLAGRGEPLVVSKPEALWTVAEPVLPLDVIVGRQLFYGADDRLTRFGAMSCQSCHPNGAADGTTWHFAEGPRQSPALWGGILGTEPFHWDQSVADMAAISDATIVGRMGGSGLDAGSMERIGRFLDTIPTTAAPRTADGNSVQRGAALFFSDAVACGTCHTGTAFSDNQAHDVGTGRGEPAGLTSFATPVLHGLAHSAPYLHDGSAPTLQALVDQLVVTDQMGHGSQLSAQDKADLVAYLKSL